MEKKAKKLALLNLTGDLSPELLDYFTLRQIQVADPLEKVSTQKWTHILTKDLISFDLIGRTYDLENTGTELISLSKVEDLQNFTKNNGNLILDEVWFKTPMGHFILDKYFQGYGGMTIGENYPAFTELGSFNIANPFNTGEYLDQMVQKAFETGIEALSLKTYFDHFIMFLAGLKKKGRAGLPFEVTYGSFETIFAVQVHFFSEKLKISDVTSSLSNQFSKKAEEYFLNTSIQSTDFFDFSYMPEVNKVIVTALWTQDERIQFENRGFMFSSLREGVTLTQYKEEGTSSAITQSDSLKDFTDRVNLPEVKKEDAGRPMMDRTIVSQESVKIVPSTTDSSIITSIQGLEYEEEPGVVVKDFLGATDDETRLIKGQTDLADLVQVVRGKFEEDKTNRRITGEKFDIENLSYQIAAKIDEENKSKNFEVRSIQEKLPEFIKSGLYDFAQKYNKDPENLTDLEVEEFHTTMVPEILRSSLVEQITDEIEVIEGDQSLEELIQTVKGKFGEEQDTILVSGSKLDIEEVAFRLASSVNEQGLEGNLKVKSLLSKLPELIKTGLTEFANDRNKEVETLTGSELTIFKNKRMPDLIKIKYLDQLKEVHQKDLESRIEKKTNFSIDSGAFKILESDLLKSNQENELLRGKLKTLASEVRILKESRSKISEINKKASEVVSEVKLKQESDQDEMLRSHLQKQLLQQKNLNEQDLQKLSGLLERESKLISALRQEQMKARKFEIENGQKETLFLQEFEVAQRQAKAKDQMLIKMKETLTKLVEKKDQEISDLHQRASQLSTALSTGSSAQQGNQIRDLEKQNQSLQKQLEVYKNKISGMASKLQPSKSDETVKEEMRKLQMTNQQIKNQVDQSKRDMEKLQSKINIDSTELTTLRSEKQKLEQQVKKLVSEAARPQGAASNPQTDQELKKFQAKNQILETQLKDSTLKIINLEAKMTELQKIQKSTPLQEDNSKGKLGQLEGSVKKLTQDLNESRGQIDKLKAETNKLRQEKISLQNTMDKMKKDAEKAKTATPKKPGSKAA